MSTSQNNLRRPSDAKPYEGFHFPRIDVADKYERGKYLSPKEKSDFGMVCSLGADQLVDCYGRCLFPGVYCNVFDFIGMCDQCPYANRHIDRQSLVRANDIHSMFSGRFVTNTLQDCIEERKPKAFVYFISDGKFVKIGKAINVVKRLQELQTSNANELTLICKIPCKSADAATEAEGRLHSFYSSYRVRGEWFDLLPYITKRHGIAEWFPEDINDE